MNNKIILFFKKNITFNMNVYLYILKTTDDISILNDEIQKYKELRNNVIKNFGAFSDYSYDDVKNIDYTLKSLIQTKEQLENTLWQYEQ